jgi:hypothetical protein
MHKRRAKKNNWPPGLNLGPSKYKPEKIKHFVWVQEVCFYYKTLSLRVSRVKGRTNGYNLCALITQLRVHAVAQLVEALRYKPEGRGFDLHNPSGRTMALGSTQSLTEMSTRNISWGKGGRCVGLTTLPPLCADCLEIWEPQPPGTLRACQGL